MSIWVVEIVSGKIEKKYDLATWHAAYEHRDRMQAAAVLKGKDLTECRYALRHPKVGQT